MDAFPVFFVEIYVTVGFLSVVPVTLYVAPDSSVSLLSFFSVFGTEDCFADDCAVSCGAAVGIGVGAPGAGVGVPGAGAGISGVGVVVPGVVVGAPVAGVVVPGVADGAPEAGVVVPGVVAGAPEAGAVVPGVVAGAPEAGIDVPGTDVAGTTVGFTVGCGFSTLGITVLSFVISFVPCTSSNSFPQSLQR